MGNLRVYLTSVHNEHKTNINKWKPTSYYLELYEWNTLYKYSIEQYLKKESDNKRMCKGRSLE